MHPALHEPFGLVGIEAASFGCPVVTSAIDGLPEAVRDGETGCCIRPDLPLKQYAEFGGSLEAMPAYVYDPLQDQLIEPVFIEPIKIAQEVVKLLNDPEEYMRLSHGGLESIDKYFSFTQHVNQVVAVFEKCRNG